MTKTLGAVAIAGAAMLAPPADPARVPVLAQIALPHNYYYRELYLPQLTSGPSSVTWSPDGTTLIYSMQGSLWRQRTDSTVAEQLTEDRGSDYQPDCSPDGRSVVFVRYDGRSMELMLIDLASRAVRALTTEGAVNVEPRWSPDGNRLAYVSTAETGHFLLHVAQIRNGRIASSRVLTPDRRSTVSRYYYSAFDHAINPTWTRDGNELLFVSNREIAHGTGDLVRMAINGADMPRLVRHEETSWHARPDVSPDGSRLVYSSYLGRQWQQLWLLPVDGGYPFPLTYGEYDDTNPRWSPDGRTIAFVSNRSGNTALWLVDATSGEQRSLQITDRQYLRPHRELNLQVVDETGKSIPARISVADSRQRSYAPDTAWIHADDMLVPERQAIETRYFHSPGRSRISVPLDRLAITVSHGPAYEVAHLEEDPRITGWTGARTVMLKRLPAPRDLPELWSGDLHVHMNLQRRVSHHADAPYRTSAGRRSQSDLQLDCQQGAAVSRHRKLSSGSRSRIHRRPVDPAWTGIPYQLLGTSEHPESDAASPAAWLRRVSVDCRGQSVSAQCRRCRHGSSSARARGLCASIRPRCRSGAGRIDHQRAACGCGARQD